MRRLTAADLLAPGRIGSNHTIYKVIKDIRYLKSSVHTLENPTALSDLTDFMGSFRAGEILLGTGTVGVDFTGLQLIYPPRSVESVLYNLLGWNDETLQVALSAEDGALYAAGGAMKVDQQAISLTGLLYAMIHTATNDAKTRYLRYGMSVLTGDTTPIGQILFNAPGGGELVDNGDFEDGDFTSWTDAGAGTWSVQGAEVYEGSYAAYFDSDTDEDGTLTSDRIAVVAGETYEFSAYSKGTQRLGVNYFIWNFYLKWYDDPAAGALISTDQVSGQSGSWVQNSGLFEAPAGAESCEIVIVVTNVNLPNQYVYFDLVSLQQQTNFTQITLEDGGAYVSDPTNGKFQIEPGGVIFVEDDHDELSGAAASLTLTATSDGTVRHHLLLGRYLSAAGITVPSLQLNGQSANYRWKAHGSDTASSNADNLIQMFADGSTSSRSTADAPAFFIAVITDSDDAAQTLGVIGLCGGESVAGTQEISMFSGQYEGAAAELDSITLLDENGNNLVAGTTMTLYRLTI